MVGIVPRFGGLIIRGLQYLGVYQAGQVSDTIGDFITGDDQNIKDESKLQIGDKVSEFVTSPFDKVQDKLTIGVLGIGIIYLGWKVYKK